MDTATLPDDGMFSPQSPPLQVALGLVIIWASNEPWRIGELTLIPREPGQLRVLGRGGERIDDLGPRALFIRQRPTGVEPTGPLRSPRISRLQLVLRSCDAEAIEIENVGRCALIHNEQPATSTVHVVPGDTLQLGSQLLLLCVTRPVAFGRESVDYPAPPFGEVDPYGIVGESPVIWALRQKLSFVGRREGHVLLLGESGSGKELAARAIHELSVRAGKAIVARNAVTIPDGLVDAELFGNLRDYPNRGMPERPGLVGRAHGSTLFLDEIGELPAPLQAHLLRVLDQGEYQRLGESTARNSDFRLIGASNRSDDALKHDLVARFAFRIDLPDLNARREDVPLLGRYLLRRMAGKDPDITARFFHGGGTGPRISLALCRQLVTHLYRANVRELEGLLWQAVMDGRGDWLEPRVARGAIGAVPEATVPKSAVCGDPGPSLGVLPSCDATLTPLRIQEALDRSNGVLETAWRALGLNNRFVLMRLIVKHRLEVRRRPRMRSRSGRQKPESD